MNKPISKVAQDAYYERLAIGIAVACCVLFLVLGLIVIPYPGIQNDEAMFGAAMFPPYELEFAIKIAHHRIPMMLMSYVGTLKTFIYWPWFQVWRPSAFSIRIPVLLAGAASVWFFFLLARRATGRRAAVVTTVLLATDVSYLLTSCYDWGPVALQHLLLSIGLVLLIKFHQDGQTWALYSGFFAFGLAMWDKALFVWILAGLVLAAAAVFPREILRRFSWQRATLSLLCFAIGASPVIAFNLKRHAQTARENVSWSSSGLGAKITQLRVSLNGFVMLPLAAESAEHPHAPKNAIENVSVSVQKLAGDHFMNFNEYAFLEAVVLLPLLWRTPARRAMLFCLIYLAVVWTQMAFTARAGTSVHHVILMWPFPLLFIAVAFAEASKRLGRFGKPVLAVVVGLMAAQNLLIYNTYLERLIRNGAAGYWTDAVYPLAGRLNAYQSKEIDVVDWGILGSLRLLDRGRLPLQDVSYLGSKPEWGGPEKSIAMTIISNPNHVCVDHVAGQEAFRGVGGRLAQLASEAGYERRILARISDSNGRAEFEIFSFRRAMNQQPQSERKGRVGVLN